jgi:hypothetical protein
MVAKLNTYFNSTNPIEVTHSLAGLNYPAGKQDMITCAYNNEADHTVLKVIEKFTDKEYGSPIEISHEVNNLDYYEGVVG